MAVTREMQRRPEDEEEEYTPSSMEDEEVEILPPPRFQPARQSRRQDFREYLPQRPAQKQRREPTPEERAPEQRPFRKRQVAVSAVPAPGIEAVAAQRRVAKMAPARFGEEDEEDVYEPDESNRIFQNLQQNYASQGLGVVTESDPIGTFEAENIFSRLYHDRAIPGDLIATNPLYWKYMRTVRPFPIGMNNITDREAADFVRRLKRMQLVLPGHMRVLYDRARVWNRERGEKAPTSVWLNQDMDLDLSRYRLRPPRDE